MAGELERRLGLTVMKTWFSRFGRRRESGAGVARFQVRDGGPSEAQFKNLIEQAAGSAQGKLPAGYLRSFVQPEQLRAQIAYYRDGVFGLWERFEHTRGLDLGCWYGFSTLLMSGFGPLSVTGTDPRADFIEAALKWSAGMDLPNLRFAHLDARGGPVERNSCDWVVANQVLCNAMPDSFGSSLRLGWEALRQDGLFLVSDSNNPHCPATIERLLTTYRTLEIGSGSPDGPDGANYRARRARIENLAPGLSKEELDSLAKYTCYLGGGALEQAVKEYRESGRAPTSRFVESVDRAPCNPINGAALGNVTDPYEIARLLEDLGGRVWIAVACGGEALEPADLEHVLRASQGFHVYARKERR